MMRRALIVAVGVLVALGIGALILLVNRAQRHGGIGGAITSIVVDAKLAVERWAGDQLLAVAKGYLNPELTFDTIAYEYPASVVLTNVRISSDGVSFLEVPSLRVEFTDIPAAGEPLVIQSAELRDPIVRVIRRENGQLAGFSDLIRWPDSAEQIERPRLSDVFAIRRIGVINGTLEYQIPARPPMVLDQMTFDLTSTPDMTEGESAQGWYEIEATFLREQLFEWDLRGRLNIDTATLAMRESTLHMALTPDQYSLLLPQVQSIVRNHEITGDLTTTVSGTIELRDSSKTQLEFETLLTDGRIAFADYVLPVQSLNISAILAGRDLTIPSLAYRGLGGTIDMDARIHLGDSYPAQMSIRTKDVRIEDAIRAPAGRQPKHAGQIDLTGTATGDLARLAATADGTGHIELRNGRLIEVPIISGLTRAASLLVPAGSGNSDHGTSELRWQGDQIQFSKIDLVTGAMAARGEGKILFDTSLDFRVSAGPLERLQRGLGGVGELFGRITDQLVSYQVTGTLAEPVVSVLPLGLGGSSARSGQPQGSSSTAD